MATKKKSPTKRIPKLPRKRNRPSTATPEGIAKRNSKLKTPEPGEVRNPEGRPVGSKNFKTIIESYYAATVQGTDLRDGHTGKIEIKEMVVQAQVMKALQGDGASFDRLADRSGDGPVASVVKIDTTATDAQKMAIVEKLQKRAAERALRDAARST